MTTATTMKFEKRNFMGIELDVLVGHPEHELLFVATQVARAAGLKHPSSSVSLCRSRNPDVAGAFHFREILEVFNQSQDRKQVFNQIQGQPASAIIQANSWLASEGWVYRMLMRGDSKAAEDFRAWIADEVVPTIRKTGKYDVEASENPIAVGIMDELKTLRGEVVELKSMIQALTAQPFSLQASP